MDEKKIEYKFDPEKFNNDELKQILSELKQINQDLSQKYDNICKNESQINNILENNENDKKELAKLLSENKNQAKKIQTLEKQLEDYKKSNDKIIESYNKQFSTLFLYTDLEATSFLKYNHELNLELLDFVGNICNKYDMKYWLDFGSLLGAVRHKGFIPWDDDLDIAMVRKDYEKFYEVINDEIKENNLTKELRVYRNLTRTKPIPIIQLLYSGGIKGTILAGVDIAPYDFIGDTSNCNSASFVKTQKSVYANNRNKMPIEVALTEYFEEFDIHEEKTEQMIPGADGGRGIFRRYKFDILKTEKIYPLKNTKFENKIFTIPNDPQYYLDSLYGDYLTIPKLISHHHHRFNTLRKRKDGEWIYKENILKMRKINETY